MADDLIAAEAGLRATRQAHVRATVVATRGTVSARPGDKALITPDGRLQGWVGGSCAEPAVIREARRLLTGGSPSLLHLGPAATLPAPSEGLAVAAVNCASEGTLQVFLEPWVPPTRVVVVGRAPVVKALVTMAGALGYESVVVEQEPLDSAESASFGVPVVHGLDLPAAGVGPDTYLVVATMGRYDEDAVEAALATDARYVAMVASAKRAATVLEALRASGVAEERLTQLRAPAGLDLGAVPHVEIAVAILAEIVYDKAAAAATASGDTAASPAEAGPVDVVDPVCGMAVTVGEATQHTVYAGVTYWFCCPACRRRFEQNPADFLEEPAGAGGAA